MSYRSELITRICTDVHFTSHASSMVMSNFSTLFSSFNQHNRFDSKISLGYIYNTAEREAKCEKI